MTLLGQLAGGVSAARAGDFNLQDTVSPSSVDTKDSSSSHPSPGLFSPSKFHFNLDPRVG